MAVTKENYERFLQSLKENRQQFTWGEGERKSTQAPDGSDPHKMLMSDLAHQREILAGQPVNDFIAGYKGDVDFEDLSRQGHLSCTIMKRRPTIPTAVVRGVLMNRGVSMTQILQGDISKELQEQVAAEFQEACSDDKKMGTLIAEAVKGACSMDINREMNEALLGKDPQEPMTPEQVQEVMGTEEGRLLSGLYLCGFRNIGQELKQLGEELMLNNQIGVSYQKQPQIMSRGVAGDAIMEGFSDQDLSDYWRMTRLTDALGAKGADPDMLLGFYSSQFYNPALPNPCGLRHYKETQMPMEEKTYGALFAGLLTQEVATEMSQKGRAGLAGASPRKYYEARSAEVKAEQELLSRQDTEDMLKNPQISAQAKKYLLDPDDRLEREIAFAHEQIDMDVRSTIISGPAGLRDAMKLFVPKISEERLDKEMSTPIAITLHPYGMSDLSVQQRMEYAGYCRKYAENMLKACQKFEAERKELEQKIFDAQQAAGGAEPDTEEYRKDHERLQQLRAFIDPRKQKAQALEGKARIAESIDRPKEALSYNPDELLDNPTLRPQVLAKLREIGKKESFVMDVMSTMRAEENERRRREGKPELEANDFALGDYRDIPKMCIVPDEILSKKDQEEYIRNWLSEWRSGPEGKNRILTEYFDRMDALAVRDGDLSCLTAEDKTETLSDGLTQSEHDFLDMLTLERNTQSRNIKGYQRNPEFFRAHYNSDKARTMYFLECDKDVMGYGQYFPIICAMNGFQISTLEDNTWGTPICTASTRGVGKELQKFDRERAALLGVEQPQERVEKLLYPPETIQRVYDPAHPEVSQEMIVDYQESLLAAIQQFERGEPIKKEEAGRIESFFRENVAAISGTRSETSATLQKEYGLDETDLLFVDGKPLKEFVGDRFGDYDSKTGNEKLQMKRQLLATYMVAAVSGKHRTEAVSLVRNGQEVPKTVVVPIRLDAHSMDEIEKKSEHNGLRRIFDFALTKIETRATKQDALWKNDPEKATRRAVIESLTAAKLEQNAADRQLKEANPDKDPKEQEKADSFTLPPLMPVPEIVVEKEEPEKPKAEAVEEKPEVKEEPEKPKAEAVEEKPEVKEEPVAETGEPEKPKAEAVEEKPEVKEEPVAETGEPEKPKAEAVEEKPEVKEEPAAETGEPEKPKAEAVEEKPEVKEEPAAESAGMSWYAKMEQFEKQPHIAARLDQLRGQSFGGTDIARENAELEKRNQTYTPENDLNALREMLNMRISKASNRLDTHEYRHMSEMELEGLGTVMEKGLLDVRNGMRSHRCMIAAQEPGSASRVYLDLLQDMQKLMMTDVTQLLKDDATLRARGYAGLFGVKSSDPQELKDFDRDYPAYATARNSALTDGISDLDMAIERLVTKGGAKLHVRDDLRTELMASADAESFNSAYFDKRGEVIEEMETEIHRGEAVPDITILVSPVMEDYLQKAVAADPQKYAAFAGKSFSSVLSGESIAANMGNAQAERKIPEKLDFVITDRQSITQDDFASFMREDMRLRIGEYRQAYDALEGQEDKAQTAFAPNWDEGDRSKKGVEEIFGEIGTPAEIMENAGKMHRAAEFGSRLYRENIVSQFTEKERRDMEGVGMDLMDAVMVGGRSLRSFVDEKYVTLPEPLRTDMYKAELVNVIMNTDLPVSVVHFEMKQTPAGLEIPEVSGITALTRNVQPAFHTDKANQELETRQQQANRPESLEAGRNAVREAFSHPRTARIRKDLEEVKTPEDLRRIIEGCRVADAETFASYPLEEIYSGTKLEMQNGSHVSVYNSHDDSCNLESNREQLLKFCDEIDAMPAEFHSVKGFERRYDSTKQYAASHSLCVDPKQIRDLGQILDTLDSREAASPWYHKDSEEYTGMHDALKAFREKTAGLDLLDPAHNARISLMMEDVYQAAEKYAATLSTRERKSTSGEIRRNAAQSILETVTRQPGKDISLSGESLLASITGTDPQKLRNADDLYHAMDTLFINGISATSYFKAVAPELHIDDEKQELAADAAERVGDRLRAIFDRAKKDPNASIFVAVEGEDGLLRSVKADASDDAKAKENVEKYNRRADRMCEDLNAARMEALESYRRGKSNDEAGLSREERRQAAIETAIQVSEGTHRKKVGLSGLTKMDNTMPKKNYSELRAAKKAEMEDGKALDSGAKALQTAAGATELRQRV